MSMAALLAIALSASLLAWLCWGDPKRRRTADVPGAGQSTRERRLLASLALLPGAVLALSGDASAFLIWMGGSAVAGWLVALSFSQLARKRA